MVFLGFVVMSAKLEGVDLNSEGVSVEANNVITDPLGNKTPTENLCDQACGDSVEGSRVVGNTETSDIELDLKVDNKESQTDCVRIASGSCVEESFSKASVDLGVDDDVERVYRRGEEGILDSATDRAGICHDMDLDTQQNSEDKVVSMNGIGNEGTESRDYLDDENASVAVNCKSDAVTYIEEASLNGDPQMVSEGKLMDMEPEDADGKDVKYAASNIEGCVQGSKTEEEGEYSVNDLVWGKVSGHPWWPGQIFESSAASRKAMKYFKKDTHLIAYFGDHTFAWNDVSRIKPFRMYFNQMEKQCYTDAFCHALDCVLDEVSRRVEFGLSCRCVPKEVQVKFTTQDVVNRGIRKESCQRDGGDNLSTASSFSPAVLIQHLKSLATSLCDGVDRLGFVVARAQVLAFNRWNCYDKLSALGECDGLLENDADIQVLQDREEEVPGWTEDDRVPSGSDKETATKSTSVKRRRHPEDTEHMEKKVKLISGSGKNSKKKTDRKLNILSSDNKHKASNLVSSDVKMKRTKTSKPPETGNNQSILPKKLLGIGERIQRAAIQLGGSPPVLKSLAEFPPVQEMLLKLSLAAKDPMNGYSMLVPFSRFFCDFRNSTLENAELHDPEEQALSEDPEDEKNTSIGQLDVVVAANPNTENQEKDSMVIESESEDPSGHVDVKEKGSEVIESVSDDPSGLVDVKEKGSEDVEPESDDPSGQLDVKEKDGVNMESESDDPSGLVDGKDEESNPTALILNFQNPESVPLGADLNKIFSRFGPLDESKTEGLGKTKCAKVVFKRQSDAEKAFSSPGKYSTFGPSLISYRLHYTPTPPDASRV
nr:PWWP domain-containing protein [Ipomoea batatas]